ncbi:hypothetical protein V6N11_052014 [Hibiscus sabdariffa]|uniref:Uncharacterized protein n=1 Tax=Hibiscus sabdariffa TaxID=183260 RepID=A0ABR2U9J5_9ROSI
MLPFETTSCQSCLRASHFIGVEKGDFRRRLEIAICFKEELFGGMTLICFSKVVKVDGLLWVCNMVEVIVFRNSILESRVLGAAFFAFLMVMDLLLCRVFVECGMDASVQPSFTRVVVSLGDLFVPLQGSRAFSVS